MTDLSSSAMQPKVGDVVAFRGDLFFEGAVQLRWVSSDCARAKKAAEHFVFHGPRYHAVSRDDASAGYILRDTATFAADLVDALAQGEQRQGNPFSLAIAGYGSGKSHLAVTLAELLSQHSRAVTDKIVGNVTAADESAGRRMDAALKVLGKPVLTVPLDGMANFNLGAELTRTIIAKLREARCDLAPVEELSPRFKAAEHFVERNFNVRASDFAELLPKLGADAIIACLREHDEGVYGGVDAVFERANGTHIPVEGRESVQDLISTVTSTYCGPDGPFSGLLILFDEFGRFLEYAAEHPQLAGDSALQQLFQGVQDSGGRARFVGFIQYDLKAYVSRLDRRDLMHLQRYITRFEAAQKYYLSTNLETLFAHLIEKRDREFVARNIANNPDIPVLHHQLREALPEAERFPVWRELEQFKQVICGGCWPLDPLAVWFLTRQQDVVQSRSALNIVKESIDAVSGQEALNNAKRPVLISAADLLLQGMLSEFVAAEQARGGTVAETLQVILEERAAHLDSNDRRLVAAAAVLLKLRVRLPDRERYERFLAAAAGLADSAFTGPLDRLTDDLGLLEWNDDYGQYELIQDAATRGQFTRLVRSRITDPAARAVGPLFASYARTLCKLAAVDPGFASEHRITTQDWLFEPVFSSSATVADSIATAFKDWQQAADISEAKGRIIYTYVGQAEEPAQVRELVRQAFVSVLEKHGYKKAPIWVALLHDSDDRLAESLQRWWVLERGLTEAEKERYRRFVTVEAERVVGLANEAKTRALSERLYEVAGFDVPPPGRLTQVGAAIFAQVYPQVVTFPFDGFTTSNSGAAKKNCLEITRALIGGEVSDEWIQSRVTQLRNRATQVLVQAWGALNRDGNLSYEPENLDVAAVLKAMDQWHLDDPSRSLEVSRRALIAAPFGFNVASAALVLGLFFARRRPRRRLLLDGKPCPNARWIGEAIKASDFDVRVLSRTTIAFIAEDTHARWEHLLENWRRAERHLKRIEYLQQADLLASDGGVPDEFLYQYESLAHEAQESSRQRALFDGRLDQLQRDLEGQIRKPNGLHGLAVADRLIALHDEVTSGSWEPEQIAEVDQLVGIVKGWVGKEAGLWLERMHCRTPQQVSEYRQKMDRAVVTLRKLGLAQLAASAERQRDHSIATVELRYKFFTALLEAQQFVRIATIQPTLTIAELEALRAKGDAFSEVLREAGEHLKDAEVAEVLEQLNRHRQSIAAAIGAHREALNKIYSSQIDSLAAAQELQGQVMRLREIFAGQRDHRDIEDVRQQLDRIHADFVTWESLTGKPEDVAQQLERAIDVRCVELERWCEDEEIETLWPFRDVYQRFSLRHVEALHERSRLWARTFVPSGEELSTWPVERCRQKLGSLDHEPPAYLADAELAVVARTREALDRRIAMLTEQAHRSEAKRWLARFSGLLERLDELSRAECERLLSDLRARPTYLNESEVAMADEVTTKVEGCLDEIDVSDIVTRIRRLKPTALRRVLDVLEDLTEKF